MWNIFGGALIIAAGLVRGNSVFLGDFNIVSIAFDGVAVYFIIKGLFRLGRTAMRRSPQTP
jgi:hypothetical protein